MTGLDEPCWSMLADPANLRSTPPLPFRAHRSGQAFALASLVQLAANCSILGMMAGMALWAHDARRLIARENRAPTVTL